MNCSACNDTGVIKKPNPGSYDYDEIDCGCEKGIDVTEKKKEKLRLLDIATLQPNGVYRIDANNPKWIKRDYNDSLCDDIARDHKERIYGNSDKDKKRD